jgi:hypothetical protein
MNKELHSREREDVMQDVIDELNHHEPKDMKELPS